MMTGMVKSIDRKNRIVNVNTGHVMISNTRIQSQYIYDANTNTIKKTKRNIKICWKFLFKGISTWGKQIEYREFYW